MSGTEIHDKAAFEKAIETKGKYVLIYLYDGEVSPKFEEYASKFLATTDSYKTDAGKYPKVKEFFKVDEIPAVIAYKDGSEVKRAAGKDNRDQFQEVAALLG